MKDKRIGLKPKSRKVATTKKGKLTGNQWQSTPQQNLFMSKWLDVTSPSFGNQYQSALAARYSPSYAQRIASADTGNQWISDYLNFTKMDAEHVKQGLQDVYLNPKTYNNSRSPADTRVKALELLARINGILDNKNSTHITLVQPILSGASVPTIKQVDNTVIDQ